MTMDREKLVERAREAMCELKYLDFKCAFDLSSGEAWCGLIKDMVAFANSGGGIIIFGVSNDGRNCDFDPAPLLSYDTADIANRMARYTGSQSVEIEVIEIKRGGKIRPAFLISDADVPIVFTKPGTYDIGGGRQKTAFGQGTIYFRHGSKSEPGNRDDLSSWRDREIAKVRKSWMGGIRKVVQAAAKDTVIVMPAPKSALKHPTVINAKVSTDPLAVSVPGNAEEFWPHRQKEFHNVNRQIGKDDQINTHDIYCIKKKFDVLKSRPDFAYKPHKDASPQYSNGFVEWIVNEYKKDKEFFRHVRTECRPKAQ